MAELSTASVTLPQPPRLQSQHQSSESTLRSNTHSKLSSIHDRTHSGIYSDEDPEGFPTLETHEPISPFDNPDLDSFRERFQALVSQINRETEEGLELIRAHAATPPPIGDANNISDEFSLPPIPPAVGYDEFGRPYRPEERIGMLNGYIRRMPTIESMGSRELGSMSAASSLYTDRDHGTLSSTMASLRSTPVSRPPTRANTLPSEHSFGSRASSRTNSIAVGAEMLLAAGATGRTTEVGELVDRALAESRADSFASSGSSYPSSMSYYTASYGSMGPGTGAALSPSPSPGSKN
ncbi:hypothetical protein H0H81_003557 [Sphagnurus paluster]|uniref:Uncharacterized protein n=1 Tax=Sphagnurus paluster TaxID=117069 RepID=A0A9P7FZ15_9AGAR|nr:hypothetical protein H0H81_003557 [Sphagnurus paluster]